MANTRLAILVVLAGLFLILDPSWAHHSEAMYDQSREVTLMGTVTAFEFLNPHTRLRFQVTRDGGVIEDWVAEMPPPNNLRREGDWTRDSIQPGDKIVVTVHVAKDGRKLADLITLIVNGQLMRGKEGSAY